MLRLSSSRITDFPGGSASTFMVQRRFSSIVSKRMLPVTSSWRVGGSPIHPGTTALHMALVSPFFACGFHMRLGAQYHSISLKLRIPRMVTRQLWSKHLARGVPSPGFRDPVCHQWSEPSETKRHGNPEDFLSCVSSRFKPEKLQTRTTFGLGIILSVKEIIRISGLGSFTISRRSWEVKT